jgi:hypothetical protein
MTQLAKILATYRPTEWTEEAFIESPPFTIENQSGRMFLIPRDEIADSVLDGITSLLGLKRRTQERTSYLVSRSSSGKTLREFDWYVRRSWRNPDLPVLWAVIFQGEQRMWSNARITLQSLSDLAGVNQKECGVSLARLFRSRFEDGEATGLDEFANDKKLVEVILQRVVDDFPTWTEERVMSILCSTAGGSAAEICEGVPTQSLSVGAVYKVLERLRSQGFVYPARYFRVNEKGPMREMLSTDCRFCFYGFTNPDHCLLDSLRQLEIVLQRNYGKVPSSEERSTLYASMKAIPYSQRINRRVITSLKLIHEIDKSLSEGRVTSLLKKIEEHYGVELPITTK